MKEELIWLVFCEDINARKIGTYNVFRHSGFRDDCRKSAKKCGDDREAFAAEVMRWLKYNFWSKCEWEIVLSSWPNDERTPKEKIDVYDQVSLNFGAFIDYLWERRGLLKKERKES